MTRIGYVGTDGRSLLAALDTSRATSELYAGSFEGVVVRGTPAMQPWAERMGWPVRFIPTPANTVEDYAQALIGAFKSGELDLALIMPESLIFQGLVDRLDEAGHGGKVIGPDSRGALYRGRQDRLQAPLPGGRHPGGPRLERSGRPGL